MYILCLPVCTLVQYFALCCSVMQCVAVCCSVLQCVAVRCSSSLSSACPQLIMSCLIMAQLCRAQRRKVLLHAPLRPLRRSKRHGRRLHGMYAVYYSVSQYVAECQLAHARFVAVQTPRKQIVLYNTVDSTHAIHCSIWYCTVHCTIQCSRLRAVYYSVLQCVAVCCRVLQSAAM